MFADKDANFDAIYDDLDNMNIQYANIFDHNSRMLITLPVEKENSLAWIARVAAIPGIRNVEPNLVGRSHSAVIPEDPMFGDQWYLSNDGDFDIDAPEAWEYGFGSETLVVGIFDERFDFGHPDLSTTRMSYFGGPGIAIPNSEHGNYVTGIIAAETDNETGIAGIAGNSMVVAFFPFTWEYDNQSEKYISVLREENFYQTVQMAITQDCDIIQMSGGFGKNYIGTETSSSAIEDAQEEGILMVFSAGNDNRDAAEYPARYAAKYSNVISVGAVEEDFTRWYDIIWSASNHGTGVTLMAPGKNIKTTSLDYYSMQTGTSFAAPIVTGVAALVMTRFPSFTPAQVKTVITSSAVQVEDETVTGGVVNAYYALAPPDAVTGLVKSGSIGQHPKLTWNKCEAPDAFYRIKRRIPIDGTHYFTTTDTTWTDNELTIDSWGILVYYAVRSEDYSEQTTAYTSEVTFRFDGGISSDGSGAEIALYPSTIIPTEFSLDSPSPNPFNASTTIRFGLPATSTVTLSIYDVQGRLVTTLLEGETHGAGWHTVSWNAGDVASGTYLLRAYSNGQVCTRKLTVIK